MNSTKNDKIPKSLFDKGSELNRLTGLPKIKAYEIIGNGVSIPDIQIKRIPKSKEYEVTAVWKKSWRMKL